MYTIDNAAFEQHGQLNGLWRAGLSAPIGALGGMDNSSASSQRFWCNLATRSGQGCLRICEDLPLWGREVV